MPYIPGTPMRRNQGLRQRSRALYLLLGRPVSTPWRRSVLDDDLLGSDWRWDVADEKMTATTH